MSNLTRHFYRSVLSLQTSRLNSAIQEIAGDSMVRLTKHCDFKQVFEKRCFSNPKGTALKFKDTVGHWHSMNWSELYEQSQLAAKGLRKLGLESGNCLAIISDNSVYWEILFYGGMLNGSVVLGIDPRTSIEQKWAMVEHSGAVALAVSDMASLSAMPERILSQLQHIILLNENISTDGPQRQIISLEALLLSGKSSAQSIEVSNEASAFLIYTSGTTGLSKGVLYSQKQILETASDIVESVGGVTSEDRFICWLPVANLFQRMMNVCALLTGRETSILSDPLALMQELPVIKPTIFIGVPRFYERVAEGIQARMQRLPSFLRKLIFPFLAARVRRALGGHMRLMFSGSAPLSTNVFGLFQSMKLVIHEAYGLSENILPVAINSSPIIKPGSVGRVLSKNTVKLAADGEVLVKGPGLAQGYFCSKDQGRWDQEGFFHTGDLARIDEEGYLYLLGRKGDLIKLSNGRRVSPLRIEEALKKVTLVDRAIVMGHGRKNLVAILTLNSKVESLSESEMHDLKIQLSKATLSLSAYEQVRSFLILKEELTIQGGHLTSNLKLRRAAVEKMYAQELDLLYSDENKGEQKQTSATLIMQN